MVSHTNMHIKGKHCRSVSQSLSNQAVQVGPLLTRQLDFTSSWQKKTLAGFQVLVDLMKPLK